MFLTRLACSFKMIGIMLVASDKLALCLTNLEFEEWLVALKLIGIMHVSYV
jgi:hypothetical protein